MLADPEMTGTDPQRAKKRRTSAGPSTSAEPPRAGRCAIVGRPNAGKSTLLNALVGQKLVIATDKPGTTRSSVLAVYTSGDPPTQIAFVDTPGLHRPKSALGSVLVEQAKAGLEDVDVVVFVATVPDQRTVEKGFDVARLPSAADEEILSLVREIGKPTILALNKIDLLKDKRWLLPIIERYRAAHEFDAVVPVSAARGLQLDALVAEVRSRLPEGTLYDPDFLTDRPERFFVAELVREAAMDETQQEVPHGLAVEIEQYIETPEMVRIAATLVVEKDSHKAIVIGARGARIKAIGTRARMEIEAFLERKVFLELWVRVDEGWTADPNRARRRVHETEGT